MVEGSFFFFLIKIIVVVAVVVVVEGSCEASLVLQEHYFLAKFVEFALSWSLSSASLQTRLPFMLHYQRAKMKLLPLPFDFTIDQVHYNQDVELLPLL